MPQKIDFHYKEQMSLDQEDREGQRELEWLEKVHEEFLENHMLSKQKSDRWMGR